MTPSIACGMWQNRTQAYVKDMSISTHQAVRIFTVCYCVASYSALKQLVHRSVELLLLLKITVHLYEHRRLHCMSA
eukprot:9336-Heterococcus_DN1.PRE.1